MNMLLKIAALAAVGVLGACGSGSGNAPISRGPETIVKGSNPTQLFSHISKQIRTCWLNPRDPVLTKHVFRAEAATGGETRIIISELTPDQKRGLKAFSIDFKPLSGGTRINAQNHRLQYGLAQKLTSDVGYWAQGGFSCDGPGTESGTELRGSVSGPRVSR
ncbi:MAG: hypothetical protein ACTSP0_01635 [Alphaproteobacteria bacterium]